MAGDPGPMTLRKVYDHRYDTPPARETQTPLPTWLLTVIFLAMLGAGYLLAAIGY